MREKTPEVADTRITRLASETARKLGFLHAEVRDVIAAALTDLATQIREDDAPYMQHLPTCGVVVGEDYTHQGEWGELSIRRRPSNKCTCGLTALRARTAP